MYDDDAYYRYFNFSFFLVFIIIIIIVCCCFKIQINNKHKYVSIKQLNIITNNIITFK